MKAIILAAGRGSRLKPYTDEVPKSLLPIGETTLIHRNIHILKNLGITDISIVVGYLKEKFFKAFPSGIKFYINEDYAQTDQAGSLFKARQELRNDNLLIITADLFCPAIIISKIVKNQSPICLVIEKKQMHFDDTIEKIVLKEGRLIQIGKTSVSNEIANGEFLGITKVSREKCPYFLKKLEDSLERNQKTQLVQILQQFIDEGEEIDTIECSDSWYEVDDLVSLEKARTLLLTNAYGEKVTEPT